ncbi:MAG: glycoside hydrolase family 16 protein [Candidatus Nanopelagicales bacterium]|nr:glycoside hydrolase family 16 protein [Candidatus Nanopelagicales bacterium]
MHKWGWPLAVAIAAILGAIVTWIAVSPRVASVPVPAGEWDQVFEDSFDGPEVIGPSGGQWGAYSGQPGGNQWGLWKPANVSIGGGQMTLKTTREGSNWVTGGAGNRTVQMFGRWEVRMRMPNSPSVKFVVQLWPEGTWPPEIDFAEGGGKSKVTDGFSAYMHWGTPADQKTGSKLQTVNRLTGIDMNDWHDVGVMWRPGSLQYTIDGRVWATVNGPNVPAENMWLAIQTEGVVPAKASDPQPPNMEVDNVKIWKWKPAAGATPSK